MKFGLKFGCVGLGRIGTPMAAHLAAGGHEVIGYDVRPEKEAEMAQAGVAWSQDVASLAAQADVIVNCVLTPADVQAVLAQVLTAAKPGTVFIEMTTLDPEQARANAARLAERGLHYLDCPVSGGADGAQRGELVLIVGGDAAVLDSLRPALAACAKHIFHVGDVGAGSTMKAIVQAMFLSHMAAFLEALSLGRAAGLPLAKQIEVLAQTTSHHPTLGKRYQQIIDGDTTPRFEIASALKDLNIVRELAARVDFSADVAQCCYDRYRQASEAGHANEDLIALLEQNASPPFQGSQE
jgi:3-hydroxyisobutyrate dehydrogenase-like beta-hydroxyacid dehydrogenase